MAEPARTAFIVLGLVRQGFRTGYEMKAAIDGPAQAFWRLSFGQVYPELKRLEDRGWLRGEHETVGGRHRTSYALTPAGAEALDGWLTNGELLFELRSEGLLKLLLCHSAAEQLAVVAAIRADAEVRRERFRQFAPPRAIGKHFQDYGVELWELTVRWCDRFQAAIEAGEIETRFGPG